MSPDEKVTPRPTVHAWSEVAFLALSVLFTLVIKSAFDHTFATLNEYSGLSFLQMLERLRMRHALKIFQMIVFLFTLVRFYLGAYSYARVEKGTGTTNVAITIIGIFVLFGGFYVTSLTLEDTQLFYYAVIAFHVVDLTWFLVAKNMLPVSLEVGAIIGLWQIFDIVTVGGIAACLAWVPGHLSKWCAMFLLLAIGVLDLWLLHPFYSNEEHWAQNTRFVRCMLKGHHLAGGAAPGA